MKFKKLGKIYCAERDNSWRYKWAILPCPFRISDDTIRIYCGFCDVNTVSRVGYVDVDVKDPLKIRRISEKPVLDIGEAGCFDDNGVVPISILKKDNKIYMYYIGFQLGVKVPYYMFCGLAISEDGEKFERLQKTPILDRNGEELFARCGCFVNNFDGIYKMWYVGSFGKGWTESQGKLKPLYMMRQAESIDGINFQEKNNKCLEFNNKDEHGFGRPYVWKENCVYKMLYSIRTYSRGYYIGYAESNDGYSWKRLDHHCGIDISNKEGDWDSKNISYPVMLNIDDNLSYLFYNGNGCGETGFGVAVLIKG